MSEEQSKRQGSGAVRGSRMVRRVLGTAAWLAVLGCCVAMPLPADAGTDGARTGRMAVGKGHHADSSEDKTVILGARLSDWTQRFWTHFWSIPKNVSPATDSTGINCGITQSGPVWFLGAASGTVNDLSCTIPAGKVILAPVAAFFNDYPCPDPSFAPAAGQSLEAFLTEGVTPIIDSVTASATLDGNALKLHRVTGPLQSFIGAKDLADLDACVTGSPQLGVADGQYVLIGPLSPGHHTLHLQFQSPILGSTDTTFHLLIQ